MTSASQLYAREFARHLLHPVGWVGSEGPPFEVCGSARLKGSAASSYVDLWMGVDEDACLTGLAWRAVGMPQVVAGLSALCERVRARQALAPLTLVDAMAITPEDIAEVLGGLPAHKIRETLVGPRLLAQAIGDYFRRCGLAGDASGDQAGDEERLCLCLGVTGRELREAVAAGHAFEECQERLGVSTGCGSCEPAARALHAWFCAERSGASPGLVSWEEV